jgi:hypothetical protein
MYIDWKWNHKKHESIDGFTSDFEICRKRWRRASCSETFQAQVAEVYAKCTEGDFLQNIRPSGHIAGNIQSDSVRYPKRPQVSPRIFTKKKNPTKQYKKEVAMWPCDLARHILLQSTEREPRRKGHSSRPDCMHAWNEKNKKTHIGRWREKENAWNLRMNTRVFFFFFNVKIGHMRPNVRGAGGTQGDVCAVRTLTSATRGLGNSHMLVIISIFLE